MSARRTRPTQPVGPHEVAELLGVRVETVHQWRFRSKVAPETARAAPLPDPEWGIVSGVPLWTRRQILAWAEETGRAAEARNPRRM